MLHGYEILNANKECLILLLYQFSRKNFPRQVSPVLNFFCFMFQWLKDMYLEFINSWKAKSEQIENISKEMKSRLYLSYQTIEGIRITSTETLLKFISVFGSVSESY